MTLDELNAADAESLADPLGRCCGSKAWVKRIIGRRPFQGMEDLIAASDEVWWSLDQKDWLEAFAAHPKIGEKRADQWSSQEQSGMHKAGADTSAFMARLNAEYEKKFGWIFIVCATGKSADEMLAILEKRMDNPSHEEIRIAASEQAKITNLRLKKLLAR